MRQRSKSSRAKLPLVGPRGMALKVAHACPLLAAGAATIGTAVNKLNLNKTVPRGGTPRKLSAAACMHVEDGTFWSTTLTHPSWCFFPALVVLLLVGCRAAHSDLTSAVPTPCLAGVGARDVV